ncbi:unnamed protein product [Onchocerca flexuosa]|uniref:Uncharacterized protein n=1 Tax=Onchocerca flexuosa TaxID=387005 RepID=A0A183HDU2_9BILA|nr:unnamed protein product [Onchocerca flexuosa]
MPTNIHPPTHPSSLSRPFFTPNNHLSPTIIVKLSGSIRNDSIRFDSIRLDPVLSRRQSTIDNDIECFFFLSIVQTDTYTDRPIHAHKRTDTYYKQTDTYTYSDRHMYRQADTYTDRLTYTHRQTDIRKHRRTSSNRQMDG